MIVVAGSISVDPEDFESYRAAAGPMIEATLAEDGCQVYTFAQSVVDPTEVRVFEIWDSKAQLMAHMETPHMAVFREALGRLKVSDRKIAMYEAEKAGDL